MDPGERDDELLFGTRHEEGNQLIQASLDLLEVTFDLFKVILDLFKVIFDLFKVNLDWDEGSY